METKHKPLNLVLHVVEVQQADINAIPIKIKSCRLCIAACDLLTRPHLLQHCSDPNLR